MANLPLAHLASTTDTATASYLPPVDAAQPPRTIVLCDSQGGLLTLDIACPALACLVDAYHCLIDGAVPPNTSLIKVDTGSQVYLLSRRHAAAGGECIRLANLYDPAQDVRLPRDLADGVFALLEQLVHLPHVAPPSDGVLQPLSPSHRPHR